MHPHLRQREQQQRAIQAAVRKVIRHYKRAAVHDERRQHRRVHFVQTVRILTEDRRELQVLTRDLSLLGVRLIGTRTLLGQKIRLWLPKSEGDAAPLGLLVHILWSNAVGDGLVENGGIFLEVLSEDDAPLKVVEGG